MLCYFKINSEFSNYNCQMSGCLFEIFSMNLSCSGCFNPWLLTAAWAKVPASWYCESLCSLSTVPTPFTLCHTVLVLLHHPVSNFVSPYSSLSLQTLSVVLQKSSSMVFPHVNDSKLQRAILMKALNTYFLKLGKSRIPKKPLLSLLLPC